MNFDVNDVKTLRFRSWACLKDTQYYQKVVDLQESSKTGKKPTKISLSVTIMPDGRSLAPLLSKTVSKNERNSL
jgi:hypothetical protein